MPRKMTEQTKQKIKDAAQLRIEGQTWDQIAKVLLYKTALSARLVMTQDHPEAWRAAYETARATYLDEIEGEAILTQRMLMRPTHTVKGEERETPLQIRQSAAHSLLSHCSKLRAQKVELAGAMGEPITIQICQAVKPEENGGKDDGEK